MTPHSLHWAVRPLTWNELGFGLIVLLVLMALYGLLEP